MVNLDLKTEKIMFCVQTLVAQRDHSQVWPLILSEFKGSN